MRQPRHSRPFTPRRGPFRGRLVAGLLSLVLLAFMAPAVAFAHPIPEDGKMVGWQVEDATQVAMQGKVTFRYDPDLATEAGILLDNIPAWWSQIETQLGSDVDDTLSIHFVKHSGGVADATGMPDWAAGVANPPRGEIIIAQHSPNGAAADLESLLRHEMVHVALHRAVGGNKVPRWFHEGVADSIGDEVSFWRFRDMGSAVFGGRIVPIEEIDAQFRSDAQSVSFAYAASRDFVSHLRWRDGEGDEFRHLIAELEHGRRFNAAVLRAYGETLTALDSEWRGGLFARFSWYPMLEGGSMGLPVVFMVPLVAMAWVRRRKVLKLAWDRMEAADQAERQARMTRQQTMVSA